MKSIDDLRAKLKTLPPLSAVTGDAEYIAISVDALIATPLLLDVADAADGEYRRHQCIGWKCPCAFCVSFCATLAALEGK